MKRGNAPSPTLERALPRAFAYLLWLVSVAVCAVAVIQLSSTLNMLWVLLGHDRHSASAVYQVSLLVGGLAALVYALFLEGYYRESVTRKTPSPEAGGAAPETPVRSGRLSRWLTRVGLDVLLRRCAITLAIPIGVAVLSRALLEVALRVLH